MNIAICFYCDKRNLDFWSYPDPAVSACYWFCLFCPSVLLLAFLLLPWPCSPADAASPLQLGTSPLLGYASWGLLRSISHYHQSLTPFTFPGTGVRRGAGKLYGFFLSASCCFCDFPVLLHLGSCCRCAPIDWDSKVVHLHLSPMAVSKDKRLPSPSWERVWLL